MQKSLAKNAVYKLLLNVFNIVVPLIVGSYVLRTLGKEEIGAVNFSQTIYQYFYMFATFGVYQYGLREISRVRDDKKKLSEVFTNLFTITVSANIITFIVYLIVINTVYAEHSIYTIAMITTINFMANIFYVEWAAEALENFDFITIKTIIIQSIYSLAVIFLVKSSSDTNIYVLLLSISIFLNFVISFIFIKKKIKFNFKALKVKSHIPSMFLVVILSNANILYTNLDKFMLGTFIDDVVVGYYTNVFGIAYIVNTLLLTLVHVTIPRLSYYLSKGDDKGYIWLFNRISRIYLMILFPAAVGLFVVGRECVLIYMGEGFSDAIPLMSYFAFYIITSGYESMISNQVMYLKGKERQQVKYVFIGGFVNLVLNTMLVVLGIFTQETAVVTTIIANSVLVLTEYIYIKKKLKLNISLFGFDKLKYFIIALCFIPITMILRNYVGDGVLKPFIVIVSVNVVFYFTVLLIIRDDIIMEGISMAKDLIKNKFKSKNQ